MLTEVTGSVRPVSERRWFTVVDGGDRSAGTDLCRVARPLRVYPRTVFGTAHVVRNTAQHGRCKGALRHPRRLHSIRQPCPREQSKFAFARTNADGFRSESHPASLTPRLAAAERRLCTPLSLSRHGDVVSSSPNASHPRPSPRNEPTPTLRAATTRTTATTSLDAFENLHPGCLSRPAVATLVWGKAGEET